MKSSPDDTALCDSFNVKTDLDDFDLVDPEMVVGARLPQPYRSIVKVLEAILNDVWTALELRHRNSSRANRVASPDWSFQCTEVVHLIPRGPDACVVVDSSGALHLLMRQCQSTLTPFKDGRCAAVSKLAAVGPAHRLAIASDTQQVVMLEVDTTIRVVARLDVAKVVVIIEIWASWLCVVGDDGIIHVYVLSPYASHLNAHENIVDSEEASDGLVLIGEVASPGEGVPAQLHFLDLSPRPTNTGILFCCWQHGLCRKYIMEDHHPPVMSAEWSLPAAVTCVAVPAPDNTCATAIAALGLASGTVILWDFHLECCCHILKRHLSAVASLAFYDRRFLISADKHAAIHVYNLEPPKLICYRHDLMSPAHPVSLGALDGAHLAVLRAGSEIGVYDISRQITFDSLTSGKIMAFAVNPDIFAVATSSGKVDVYSACSLALHLRGDVGETTAKVCDSAPDLVPPECVQQHDVRPSPPPGRPYTSSRRTQRCMLTSQKQAGDEEDINTTPQTLLGYSECGNLSGHYYVNTDDLVASAINDAFEKRAARELDLDATLRSMQERLTA